MEMSRLDIFVTLLFGTPARHDAWITHTIMPSGQHICRISRLNSRGISPFDTFAIINVAFVEMSRLVIFVTSLIDTPARRDTCITHTVMPSGQHICRISRLNSRGISPFDTFSIINAAFVEMSRLVIFVMSLIDPPARHDDTHEFFAYNEPPPPMVISREVAKNNCSSKIDKRREIAVISENSCNFWKTAQFAN